MNHSALPRLSAELIQKAAQEGLWLLVDTWIWLSPAEAQWLLDHQTTYPESHCGIADPVFGLIDYERRIAQLERSLRVAREQRKTFAARIVRSAKAPLVEREAERKAV